MKYVVLFTFVTVFAPLLIVAYEPFRLPVGAIETSASPDGRGWLKTGVIPVTFVSARQQFASAIKVAGWRCVHSIPIGGADDKTIVSWRRGRQELTVMLWRIAVDRTGFSWGLTEVDNGKN